MHTRDDYQERRIYIVAFCFRFCFPGVGFFLKQNISILKQTEKIFFLNPFTYMYSTYMLYACLFKWKSSNNYLKLVVI